MHVVRLQTLRGITTCTASAAATASLLITRWCVWSIRWSSKACGYFTRISQLPSLFPNSPGRKIPDQVIFDYQDNENLATDTAVSSPVAACFLDAGSARAPLRAAERREARKTRDYRALCRLNEMGFTPLVFETFGAWGCCMQGFFQAAVDAVSNRLEEDVLDSWTCTTFSTFSFFWGVCFYLSIL